MKRCVVRHLVTLFAGGLLLPSLAFAQTAAGIAGVGRDTSGAVLPGVTVEAASPALIEKVRSVVTDTAGQYRILELRPGTYSVTFSLPGFNVVKRDGLVLTSGFTATINAELPLGSVNETITVSGAAPVVDVQNTQTQSVLPTAVLDTLPVSRAFQGWGVITLVVLHRAPLEECAPAARGPVLQRASGTEPAAGRQHHVVLRTGLHPARV